MAEVDVVSVEPFETMMSLRPGMTAKQAATLLSATPPTWRLYGMADGTIVIGPRRAGESETEPAE